MRASWRPYPILDPSVIEEQKGIGEPIDPGAGAVRSPRFADSKPRASVGFIYLCIAGRPTFQLKNVCTSAATRVYGSTCKFRFQQHLDMVPELSRRSYMA